MTRVPYSRQHLLDILFTKWTEKPLVNESGDVSGFEDISFGSWVPLLKCRPAGMVGFYLVSISKDTAVGQNQWYHPF